MRSAFCGWRYKQQAPFPHVTGADTDSYTVNAALEVDGELRPKCLVESEGTSTKPRCFRQRVDHK
jgi:hypothetical protein